MITLHSPSVQLLSMHVPVGFARFPIHSCRRPLLVRCLAVTSPLSGSRRPPSTPCAERTCCSLVSAYCANVVRFWPGTNHWHELKTATRRRPKRNVNGHHDQQSRGWGATETPRRPQELRARRCSRVTITSVVCWQKYCRISYQYDYEHPELIIKKYLRIRHYVF